ncbi:putative uncharacterized protein DDB_G0282133 [Hydra vulgaris]|uniref:MANSC domain-containing protein n=1 Tax=Hydra vulgaris TaxID=6087 RepID=A0ABM4C3I6_HYDVU
MFKISAFLHFIYGLFWLLSINKLFAKECTHGGILENMILEGGINSNKHTIIKGINSVNLCIDKCCTIKECDLAMFKRNICYSVSCDKENSCQISHSRNNSIENAKIVFMTRPREEASRQHTKIQHVQYQTKEKKEIESEEDELDEALIESGDDINDLTSGSGITVGNDTLENEKNVDASLETDDSEGSSKDLENEEIESEFSDNDFESGDSLLIKNNHAGVIKHEVENKFQNQIENLNFKSNNSKQQYKKENDTKLDSTLYHYSLKNTSLNAFKLMQNLSSSKNISNENNTDHLKHFNRTKKISDANYFLENNLSNYTSLKKMEKNITQLFNFSLPANISKYKSMSTNSQKFQIKQQPGNNITDNFLIKSKRLNDKGTIKNKELSNSKKDKHSKFNTNITNTIDFNNLDSNGKVYQKDSKNLKNSYSNKTKLAKNSPTLLHNASTKLYNAPLKLYDAPTISYNAPTTLYNNHTMRRRIDLLNLNNELISNFTIFSPARISSPTQDSFVTEISTEFKNEQDNATYPVQDETDVIITPDGVLTSKLDNRTNEYKKDKENSVISNEKYNRKIISDNDNHKISNDIGNSKTSNVSNFLVNTDSLQMNVINISVNRNLMPTTSKSDIDKEISGESENSGDSDSFVSGDSGDEYKSFKNNKGILSGSGDAFTKDTEYNQFAEKIEDALDESTSIKKKNITHYIIGKNKASTTEKPTKDLFFMEIEDELLSGNGSNLTSQLQDQQSSGDINNLTTETKNISKVAERIDALEQDIYWLDIINKTADTLLRNNSVDFLLTNKTWSRNQSDEMNSSINSNSMYKTVLKENPSNNFKTSSESFLNSLKSENLTYNNIMNETMSPTPQTRQLSQPIATMGIAKTQEESKEETLFNKTFTNYNESTDQKSFNLIKTSSKFSVVQNETWDVQDKTADAQNETTGVQTTGVQTTGVQTTGVQSKSIDFQIEDTGFQDQTTRIQNETIDISDKRLYGSEYDEKNENAYQTFPVAPISLYPKVEFLKIYTPSKKSFLPLLKDNGYYNHGKYSDEEENNNEQVFNKKDVETKTRIQQSYDSISRDLIQTKDDSLKTEQKQGNGFMHAFERKQNKYDTVNFDPRVHYLGDSESRVSDTRDNKLDQTLESSDISFSSFSPDSSNEKFENIDTDGQNRIVKTHLINTGIPANTKLGKMLMADLSEEESLGNAYSDQPTFKNPSEFKIFYQTNENGLGKINGEMLDQDPVQQNQIFDNEALNDFKDSNEPVNSNYMYSDKAFKVKENFFERKSLENSEAVLKTVSKKKVKKSRTKNEKNKNYQNGNKNISWKTSNGTKIFPIKTKNNGPHRNIMPQSENTPPISRMLSDNSFPSKNLSNSTDIKTKLSRVDKISEIKAKKEENKKNDKLEETNFTKKKIKIDYTDKKEKEEENVIQGMNEDINEKQYKILNEKLPQASIPWEKLGTNHNISINAADDNEGKTKTRKLFQTNKEKNLFKEKHNQFNILNLSKVNSRPYKNLNHNKPKTSNSQYARYALYRSKFYPPKNYNARKKNFSQNIANVIKKFGNSLENSKRNYKNGIKVNSKKSLKSKHKSKEYRKKNSEGMKTPKKNALAQLQDLITQAKIGRYENVGNALSKTFQNSEKTHFGVDERNIHQTSNHSINQRRYQKIKEVREKVLRRFSSNGGTCRRGLTIHGGTLRGGVLSGEFKSMGVVDTQKACVQKCCKSDRCDVAMTIGRECINIRCFNRKLCNIAPAGNVGVYRDVLPVVTFVNRPVHNIRRSEIPRPLLFSEQDPYSVSEIIQQLDESEFSEVRKIINELDQY